MRFKRKWTSDVQSIQSHKDLLVWRKSVTLATKVYSATIQLPADERYGLAHQIRQSAVSVASNIAEGAARSRRAEFIHFLNIARGSLAELETQVSIAADLNMLNRQLDEDIREVSRMLTALIRRLKEQHTLERVI